MGAGGPPLERPGSQGWERAGWEKRADGEEEARRQGEAGESTLQVGHRTSKVRPEADVIALQQFVHDLFHHRNIPSGGAETKKDREVARYPLCSQPRGWRSQPGSTTSAPFMSHSIPQDPLACPAPRSTTHPMLPPGAGLCPGHPAGPLCGHCSPCAAGHQPASLATFSSFHPTQRGAVMP